jgi:lipopolysaccharide transport system ATP-binding protein
MSDLAVRVSSLSKRYRGGRSSRYRTLREVLAESASAGWRRLGSASESRRPDTGRPEFWALRDLSFDVPRGQVLGIIGRNGAGKSTLLKILSRIIEPTDGRAEISGRVGSLLEVGTGFHPELSGRENIYLNGAILGMRKIEIDRKFDEIVAFAETERFLDMPVKHYSSGMHMRLAFGVAAHLDTQVLLVDEVLAVGDAAFQRKCLGKIGDVAHGGRTILFVSHQLEAIQRLCHRVLLLEGGRITADGPSGAIVTRYLSGISGRARANEWIDLMGLPRTGSGAATFSGIQYASDDLTLGLQPYTGGPLEVTLTITSDAPRTVGSLAVTIYNQFGTKLVNAETMDRQVAISLQQGLNQLKLTIQQLHLNPGVYRLGLWLADPIGGRYSGGVYDCLESAFEIEVFGREQDHHGLAADGVVPCDFTITQVASASTPG